MISPVLGSGRRGDKGVGDWGWICPWKSLMEKMLSSIFSGLAGSGVAGAVAQAVSPASRVRPKTCENVHRKRATAGGNCKGIAPK